MRAELICQQSSLGIKGAEVQTLWIICCLEIMRCSLNLSMKDLIFPFGPLSNQKQCLINKTDMLFGNYFLVEVSFAPAACHTIDRV